jgi:hypothetical protein
VAITNIRLSAMCCGADCVEFPSVAGLGEMRKKRQRLSQTALISENNCRQMLPDGGRQITHLGPAPERFRHATREANPRPLPT